MQISHEKETVERIISIAMLAGKKILEIYNSPKKINVKFKNNNSPVTEADLLSQQIICEALNRFNINIPILSEESATIEFSKRKKWNQYWLIDPLDGTKEFINHLGQFTVNIALIENHLPVLGVVYSPTENICYYASDSIGAYKQDGNGKRISILTSKTAKNEMVVAISNHEKNPVLDQFLQSIGPHTVIRTGSSIKICLVAEGVADLYPRLFPTSEWDTGAAHCILLKAEGDLYINRKIPLRYNQKSSLLNPNFLAISRHNIRWLNGFFDYIQE